MKLRKRSPFTGKINVMELPITEEQYAEAVSRYNGGVPLQDAFSLLSTDEMEFVKSGATPEDCKLMFPDGNASDSFKSQTA